MNKLKLENDWGSYIYFFEGIRINSNRGGIATIEFPDKHISEVKYTPVTVVEHVNDMGHEYTVTSQKLIASLHHHSQILKIELSELNVIALKPGK